MTVSQKIEKKAAGAKPKAASKAKKAPPKFPKKKEPSDHRKVEAYSEWQGEMNQARRDIMALETQKAAISARLKAAQKDLDGLLDRGPEFEKQETLFPDKKPKAAGKKDGLLTVEFTVKPRQSDGREIYSYNCPHCGSPTKQPDKPEASETCPICSKKFRIVRAKSKAV